MNGINRTTIGGYVCELKRFYETRDESKHRLVFAVVIPERVPRPSGKEVNRKTVLRVVHSGAGTRRLWEKLFVGDYIVAEGRLHSTVTRLKARFNDTGKVVLRHNTTVIAETISVMPGIRKIYKVAGKMVVPDEDEASYDVTEDPGEYV
jgi:hypothetical protein